MTTLTEDRIEDRIKIEGARVRSFLNGTRDPNAKLHEHFAVGFQLELMLQAYANTHAFKIDPRLRCGYMRTSFKEPVPINGMVDVKAATPADVQKYESKGGPYAAGFNIEMRITGKEAVSSDFIYGIPTDAPKVEIDPEHKGHLFTLTRHRARQTAYGIIKADPDYYAEAIGLISNALFQDHRKTIEKYAEINQLPVYVGHALQLTPELGKLNDGDDIRVKTTKRREIKGTVIVDVTGATPAGKMLYDGYVTILFANPTSLNSP